MPGLRKSVSATTLAVANVALSHGRYYWAVAKASVRFLPVTERSNSSRQIGRAGFEKLPLAIAGERASWLFLEFFTANIPNRNTRAAYARAVSQFLDGAKRITSPSSRKSAP